MGIRTIAGKDAELKKPEPYSFGWNHDNLFLKKCIISCYVDRITKEYSEEWAVNIKLCLISNTENENTLDILWGMTNRGFPGILVSARFRDEEFFGLSIWEVGSEKHPESYSEVH